MKNIKKSTPDWLSWQPKGLIFEKYSKINSSKAIGEIKLTLYRIVHSISLYKNIVFIAIALYFGRYGNFKFP